MKDMLKGQVAIIAGGTSGMGEATAKYFAREGAVVIIGGTSEKKGKAVVEAIEAEGGVARYYAPLRIQNNEDCLYIVEKNLRRQLRPLPRGDLQHHHRC